MTTTAKFDLAAHNRRQQERADEHHRPVVTAYAEALMSLHEIAQAYGISYQRAWAIIDRARKRGILPS